MSSKTSQYYDKIYAFKNYPDEVARVRRLIEQQHPTAQSVLDVACGTGEHARLLSEHYTVDGIDIDPNFIVQARLKVPRGEFIATDMRRFAIGKKYDVVLCLFSSIGYLTEPQDMVSALRCFAAHLQPDGIIIVEPWLTPDVWTSGQAHMTPPVNEPELKVSRVSYSVTEGDVSVLNFHYLVGTNSGVEYLQETHRLALYTVADMQHFFAAAGLVVDYDPKGLSDRGLYLAAPSPRSIQRRR